MSSLFGIFVFLTVAKGDKPIKPRVSEREFAQHKRDRATEPILSMLESMTVKVIFKSLLICSALIFLLGSKNNLGQVSSPNSLTESYSSLAEAAIAVRKDDPPSRSFLENPFIQSTILTALDGGNNDRFGSGIAIDGDTAVIGSQKATVSPGMPRGAVYIFTRRGLVWTLHQKITASDAANNDDFGGSVDIEGDVIVVGANGDDTGTIVDHGSAYVFTRSGSTWTQQQKLTASDQGATDGFGSIVAVSGETVLIGASADNARQGSVYVFTRNGTGWSEQAKLVAGDGTPNSYFGASLALDGDYAIVGASYAPNDSGHGAAYIFHRSGSTWIQQRKLVSATPEPFGQEKFGSAVDIAGNTAVVGSPSEHGVLGGSAPGVVYVFVRNGGSWTTQSRLFIPSPSNGSDFGGAVALEHDQLAIGSPTAWTTINGGYEGAAYVYVRQDSTWAQRSKMIASNPATFARFGGGIDISESTVLIGASGANSAYVFLDTTNVPDLRPESDTGISNTDNITNSSNLIFDIPDVTSGATIDLMRNGTMVASVVANSNVVTLADANPPATGNARYLARQTLPNSSVIQGAPTVVTLNNVPPNVSIDQAPGQPDPAGSSPINYRVQFDAPVTGFGVGSLSFAGSTVNLNGANAIITGSGATYNVAVSIAVPNGGFLRVSIITGAAQDEFGNISLASTSSDNAVGISYVADGGFELTNATGQNPYWTSTSTRFGTSLCTVAACGTGNGTASPRTGTASVWFDGSDNTAAEQATASQIITFPSAGRAFLNYYLRIGSVNAPSTSILQVSVDGAVVQTISEPPVAESSYTLRTIDLGAYADGGTHSISFQYNRPGGVGPDNFTIDDVSLSVPLAYVSGRVLTAEGRGVRNATVSINDGHGFSRTVMTNPFGIYSLNEIPPTGTYTVTVTSRRFSFGTRIVNVTGDSPNVDFIGGAPMKNTL